MKTDLSYTFQHGQRCPETLKTVRKLQQLLQVQIHMCEGGKPFLGCTNQSDDEEYV